MDQIRITKATKGVTVGRLYTVVNNQYNTERKTVVDDGGYYLTVDSGYYEELGVNVSN